MCSRVYGEQTIGNVPTETSDTVRAPRGRARALTTRHVDKLPCFAPWLLAGVSGIPCSSVEEPKVRWFDSSHGNKDNKR